MTNERMFQAVLEIVRGKQETTIVAGTCPLIGPPIGALVGPLIGPPSRPPIGPLIGPPHRPPIGPLICPLIAPPNRPPIGPLIGPPNSPRDRPGNRRPSRHFWVLLGTIVFAAPIRYRWWFAALCRLPEGSTWGARCLCSCQFHVLLCSGVCAGLLLCIVRFEGFGLACVCNMFSMVHAAR